MDNGSTMPESSLHNWVLANQHVAAALKHLLVDKDSVFQRMLPG